MQQWRGRWIWGSTWGEGRGRIWAGNEKQGSADLRTFIILLDFEHFECFELRGRLHVPSDSSTGLSTPSCRCCSLASRANRQLEASVGAASRNPISGRLNQYPSTMRERSKSWDDQSPGGSLADDPSSPKRGSFWLISSIASSHSRAE